ncbi:MAG: 3-hydroxyacyl-ACP dehydratase FabZ [Gammaproteobacteria bacterium]|nr:3-hydroxyacyl-ACP dehydratase FabZ [Gammaproteobacteria bacterium]
MTKLDVHEILEFLPHRYPFMLVDRVVEYEEGKSLVALKNVTYNEPFFSGHFPAKPVMPGVLVVEALAQAAGLLVYLISGDKNLFYFAGIDNARFKKVVEPGDQLQLKVAVERRKRDVWKFKAEAFVDGVVACSANLMIAR